VRIVPEVRLVSPREAMAMCGGISPKTADRWMAERDFPRPIVLSRGKDGRPARVAFVYSELVEWNEAMIAKCDRGGPGMPRKR
jgi:predicted DNA-binding transcriptional regulator AlpA